MSWRCASRALRFASVFALASLLVQHADERGEQRALVYSPARQFRFTDGNHRDLVAVLREELRIGFDVHVLKLKPTLGSQLLEQRPSVVT